MAGSEGSAGATHDERLLRVPVDREADDERRLDRIRTEVDAAFDALRDIEDGVSVFGSARIGEGHRWYELCRETAACLARDGYTLDDTLEDDGLIDSVDKQLLVVADTPQEVCDHVHRAREAQRREAQLPPPG